MNDDNNTSRHKSKHNEYNSDQLVPNTEQNGNKKYGGNIQRHRKKSTDFYMRNVWSRLHSLFKIVL